MESINVLVVDDTILYRKVIGDVIAAIPGAKVCGTAANGRFALTKIDTLKPDLITLDVEMPEMNGLELLEQLAKKKKKLPRIIMVSTLTTRGGPIATSPSSCVMRGGDSGRSLSPSGLFTLKRVFR